MELMRKYKTYIINPFILVFILYINVAMGFSSDCDGILTSLYKAINIKSISFGFISSVILVIYNLRFSHGFLNKKLNNIFVTVVNSWWLLYTNHIMSIISNKDTVNYVDIFTDINLIVIAMFGIMLVILFEIIIDSKFESFYNPSIPKTPVFYILIPTFILLETNVAMGSSYSGKDIFTSIIVPNTIIIGIIGSYIFSLLVNIKKININRIDTNSNKVERVVGFAGAISTIFALTISDKVFEVINNGIPFNKSFTGVHEMTQSDVWIIDAPILIAIAMVFLALYFIIKNNAKDNENKLSDVIDKLESNNDILAEHIANITDKLNEATLQIEEIKYINNFVYTQISSEELSKIEMEAEHVFIVSESLKFEKNEYTIDKIKETIKKDMYAYLNKINKGQMGAEPKYKFLLRDDEDYDNSVENIKKIYFAGLLQKEDTKIKYINKWVSKIPSQFFDLLRPFPERTFLNKDGTMIKCEIILSKSDNVYVIKHENITSETENKRFVEAFRKTLGNSKES